MLRRTGVGNRNRGDSVANRRLSQALQRVSVRSATVPMPASFPPPSGASSPLEFFDLVVKCRIFSF